ncbi:restriction endonuclease subunit S [Dermabacteraceae bacterium P13147]
MGNIGAVKEVPLRDVCEYVRGVTYKKSDEVSSGGIPVLRSNNISLPQGVVNFDDLRRVSASVRIKPEQFLKPRDILMSAASGSKAHVGKVAYWELDSKFSFGGFMAVLRPDPEVLDPKFLYFILSSPIFGRYMGEVVASSTINNLNAKILGNLKVPLPDLKVQIKIAKMLDKFVKLEAELEAELEARRRQYDFYKESLMSSVADSADCEKVDYVSLRDVTLPDKAVDWKSSGDKSFKYVDLSSVDRVTKRISNVSIISAKSAPSRAQRIITKGDVLFGTTRPLLKRYCLVGKEYDGQIASTGYCVLRPNPKKILNSFLFHVVGSKAFYEYIDAVQSGASYPAVSNNLVKSFTFPLPPLGVQARVSEILDKFDALVNDISIGLPAEIAARRKQYEYYRDRLLAFEGE